jgi:hypothetical protein
MDDETELPYPLDEIDIEAELSLLEAIGTDEGGQDDVLEDGTSLSTHFAALPSTFFPSQSELDQCPNNRLKEALRVWYLRLRELYEFKEQNGHCNVPQKYEPHQSLGIWVNKQRSKRSSLSQQKVQALDSIGFDWGTRRGDQVWRSKFNELVEYKRRHGDCKYHHTIVKQHFSSTISIMVPKTMGIVFAE